jgi:alkylation response protein AidB-like acyl-CoA dehydrogenase
VIAKHREANEANRRLADEVYDAMLGQGLFRLLTPEAFGGLELHPTDAYRVWYAVARIDTAAGWNLQIAAAAGGFLAFLPQDAAAEVYADGPDVVAAGAFFPPGAATRVPGGWRVTGRTPFASGSDRATWFMMPAVEMDGDAPKIDPATGQPAGMAFFVPRSEVRVITNWNTAGMRGTGSNDIAVDDVFVPDHRIAVVAPLNEPAPAYAGPLYQTFPWWAVHGESIPSIAAADVAIDALVDLALTKRPNYRTGTLRESELAQHHVGKARALAESARSFLYSSISEAYDNAVAHGRVSERNKELCQLAGCWAADASAQAVDLVHEAAGSSGFRLEHPFDRHFRDVHTLTQHASKSVNRYTSAGKLELGLPQDWFALSL